MTNRLVRWITFVVALTLLLPGCGDDADGGSSSASPPPTTTAPVVDGEAFGADLETWVADELAAEPELPGEIVLVDAPGVHVVTAQGVADGLGGTEPLTPEHRFRIASVTKTFVAATVLRLVEEGELGLEDPIADHLPTEYVDLLEADGYPTDEITVHQLLDHTSGTYDYAFDDDYVALAATDVDHRWTPEEQVRFAMDHGDPLFPPGERHAYGDTNYVLLGQIIEATSGQPLAEAVRTILDFEGLGLRQTFFETLEPDPDPGADRMHNIFDTLDLTAADPSVDLYGGGGLVSTVEDLARFYAALFGGEVFEDPRTLETMSTPNPVSGRERAAMGLFQVEAAGDTCLEHAGFYGTVAFHCPAEDLTIIRQTGQAYPAEDWSFANLNIRIVSALN